MPIQIKIPDAGTGIEFYCVGTLTGENIIKANDRILSVLSSGERITITKYCVVDYSEVTQYNISASEIDRIAAQDQRISKCVPDYMIAIIAKKSLQFGVSRMWETIVKTNDLKWETMVFMERSKAEEWIKRRAKEKYNIDITTKDNGSATPSDQNWPNPEKFI